jgi:hypothetical protein
MKKMALAILCTVMILACGLSSAHAVAGGSSAQTLTAGAVYTITIQKMNSNGTVSDYSSTTATADGNGKLVFTLSSMPTNADCNFLVFIVKDSDGAVQRKGFVPAPPAGNTNQLGINGLSTVQTDSVLAAAQVIGTDDPIPVAYLLTLLRSDLATVTDATALATLGSHAITGTGGFEDTLLTNGVTTTQLAAFKGYLIYNPDPTKKTLRYLTAQFKNAVDSANTATARELMQKAGGYMADVFMDAADSAGIDFGLILAGHDAAGVVASNSTNQELIQTMSPGVQIGIQQATRSFHQRIAAVKVKSEYTKALTTLNASGTQVDTFNAAVSAMMTAMELIDADYAGFFSDPQGYLASHGTTQNALQAAIDARYQAAFTDFQAAIASSPTDINTMKSNVAAAFGINQNQLPSDFGHYTDFNGVLQMWPIPQTVMVNWMASILAVGGSFGYTRDTLAIPAFCLWIGVCSNQSYPDPTSCQSHGATWLSQRHDFSGGPSPAFSAYLGLMEDINIIQANLQAIYQNGGNPTQDQERVAKLLLAARLEDAAGRISGTVDSSGTPISLLQKMAIIKLLMQPNMD